MGRGRQKAKHTKVARELKYFSPETNYGALAQELSTAQQEELSAAQQAEQDSYVDRWASEYADDDGDETDTEPQQDKSA